MEVLCLSSKGREYGYVGKTLKLASFIDSFTWSLLSPPMCQGVVISKSIKERFGFPGLLTSERDRKQIIKAVFYVIMNM